MPARTRVIAVLVIPSFIAIASAILNPIPRMSRVRRPGFFVMTSTASVPQVLKTRTARAVATPWLCRKTNALANRFLLGPRVGDAPGANLADAGDLAKPFGLGLDDVEHLVAERLHQLAGVDLADAAYHARAQVLLDALGRRRRRAAQEVRLELVAVGAVVDPLPGCGDPLPGRDRGGAADDGEQVTVAPRLDPEHAEPVVRVVVADVLDQPASTLSMVAARRFFDRRRVGVLRDFWVSPARCVSSSG